MNDEKKLNEKKLDEKTLEEVTGGNSQWEYSEDEGNFIVANCIGYCVYEGPGGCPYADKHAAYAARNPDGSCPGQKKHKDLT